MSVIEEQRRPLVVRSADAAEIDQLAKVWYDAWRDAHAHLLPESLVRARSLESFRQRIQDALGAVRVVGSIGSPLGLCTIKGEELYQLFVAAEARGTGAAAALLADGETRLLGNGVQAGWLACAIGNDRAARFYEKQGWRRVGTVSSRLETPVGEFVIDVWRYEKVLSR